MNDRGQATIEFILTFTFVLGFCMSFIYFALNYTGGYLAHYATFASSRAYLTAEDGGNTRSNYQYSKDVAEGIFSKFPLKSFGIKHDGISFNDPGAQIKYEFVGAYLLFDPSFKLGDEQTRSLLTESFLGKEPTRADCRCQVKKSMGKSCNQNVIRGDVTLYDNGC